MVASYLQAIFDDRLRFLALISGNGQHPFEGTLCFQADFLLKDYETVPHCRLDL